MCIRKIDPTGVCRTDGRGRDWRQGSQLSRSTIKSFCSAYHVPGHEHREGQSGKEGLKQGVRE